MPVERDRVTRAVQAVFYHSPPTFVHLRSGSHWGLTEISAEGTGRGSAAFAGPTGAVESSSLGSSPCSQGPDARRSWKVLGIEDQTYNGASLLMTLCANLNGTTLLDSLW